MTDQTTSPPVPDAPTPERLLAEYRKTIIQLEAHGSPDEQNGLWDLLDGMLADMKRQQAQVESSRTPIP